MEGIKNILTTIVAVLLIVFVLSIETPEKPEITQEMWQNHIQYGTEIPAN